MGGPAKDLSQNENTAQTHLVRCAIVLAMSALFLAPALDNGFPFVFDDTGTYLTAALDRHIPANRSVYYSIFTTFFDWRLSPWPSVLVQSVITAGIIRYFVSAIFSLSSAARILLLAFLLTLGTSL